jgi:hypothetical protein
MLPGEEQRPTARRLHALCLKVERRQKNASERSSVFEVVGGVLLRPEVW